MPTILQQTKCTRLVHEAGACTVLGTHEGQTCLCPWRPTDDVATLKVFGDCPRVPM